MFCLGRLNSQVDWAELNGSLSAKELHCSISFLFFILILHRHDAFLLYIWWKKIIKTIVKVNHRRHDNFTRKIWYQLFFIGLIARIQPLLLLKIIFLIIKLAVGTLCVFYSIPIHCRRILIKAENWVVTKLYSSWFSRIWYVSVQRLCNRLLKDRFWVLCGRK